MPLGWKKHDKLSYLVAEMCTHVPLFQFAPVLKKSVYAISGNMFLKTTKKPLFIFPVNIQLSKITQLYLIYICRGAEKSSLNVSNDLMDPQTRIRTIFLKMKKS